MNQSLFLIDDSFFTSPAELSSQWVKVIEKCSSEKIVFIYDPLCLSLFREMSSNEKALELLICSYYEGLEELSEVSLTWGELDSYAVLKMDALSLLMNSIDIKSRSVCSYGCFPMVYDKILFYMFYFITPGGDYMSDKYYLISRKDFDKNYKLIEETKEMLKM